MNGCYDIAVIGAGVTGAATAAALSRYRLNVALLEKEADAGFGVSKANSGIVHGGFHYPLTTLKGRLEILGNLMFEKLHYELGFPYRRCGIIVAAFSEEEVAEVRRLYRQGVENRVPRIELCSAERMLELEPKLAPDVAGGLYAPGGGVVEPYRYVFSLLELAKRNGVEFLPNCKLENASFANGAWTLQAHDGRRIRAKYAVKVVFPVPVKHSKGVLVIPTVDGTTMVGPTAEIVGDKEDHSTTAENRSAVFRQARRMVPAVSERDLITGFSGSRPVMEGNDFYIAFSKKAENLIQAAGIQSPGLTASPAIAGYICGLLRENGVRLEEKAQFASMLEPSVQIRRQSAEEADRLHKEDPAWTNIICRCEKISEAEIVDAIRHGHTTLDGIKFYTRAGMGRCQGGFCSYKILKIIARETGMSLEEATKRGGNTGFISGHLGDMGKRG